MILKKDSPAFLKQKKLFNKPIMQIALAKSRSMRGASHQPASMGSCLTISYTCLSCLPGRDWLVLMFYSPL